MISDGEEGLEYGINKLVSLSYCRGILECKRFG
jgi:hypothetical protein